VVSLLALYAIGDLHLSLGCDKPMDIFGGGWNNYVEKIKSGFSTLKPDDVCVLCGDSSWGMTFEESLEDFKFISELPGKKIILKGNHDYWWNTVKKLGAFFSENGIKNIDILNNNCFLYENAAICGTRGWMTEGEVDTEHNTKIMAREAGRLCASLQAAGNAEIKLCFLHYPPLVDSYCCQEIIDIMREYGVTRCYYGHLHGKSCNRAKVGMHDGIDYQLVSADHLGFVPMKILGE
jgi:predicted phosphohydrolase